MFSLVIPTYDDPNGVNFTLAAIKANPGIDLISDISVLDNFGCETTEKMCKSFGVNYAKYTDKIGTTHGKAQALQLARQDWVICIDSHVILLPNALFALQDYLLNEDDDTNQIIHGPIVKDNFDVMATHFDPGWRGGMFGKWAKNPLIEDPDTKHFEIPGMGMGLFVINKKTWPGFNPNFKGFGVEEMYIHEKYRRQDGKVVCVTGLKWWHRFWKPKLFPRKQIEFANNYKIAWEELGWDIEDVRKGFVDENQLLQSEWDSIMNGTVGCGTCGKAPVSLEQRVYQPDIAEHLPVLTELASKCEVVVDCGSGLATLQAFHKGCTGTVVAIRGEETSLNADIPDNQLLFLDTDPHTAQHVWEELMRNHEKCHRYIVFHDTEIFGMSYGNEPGVMHAIRRFVTEFPKWKTVAHYTNNNGLTVLSCNLQDHPPAPPSKPRMGLNYLKSTFKHWAGGSVELPMAVQDERKEICYSNGGRCPSLMRRIDDNQCAGCGCPILEKIKRPNDACPFGHWGAVTNDEQTAS